MNITINTWNTSGGFEKEWTESSSSAGSTMHTIGDLKPNKPYIIKVDGNTYTNATTDANGQLSFDYTGGYSTHSFSIVEGAYGGGIIPQAQTQQFFASLPQVSGSSNSQTNTTSTATAATSSVATDTATSTTTSTTEQKVNINDDTTVQTNITKQVAYTRNLYRGISGSDVSALQQFLAQNISVYPEGEVTGFYGVLTMHAVERFQCKNDIVCGGDESSTGYGVVGPKTRKVLNATNITTQAETEPIIKTTVESSGRVFPRDLSLGDVGNDVKRLQQFLNNNGFPLAGMGSGSPGQETTYFGVRTRSALLLYQNAHREEILTPIGLSAGTGYFGPATRAKMESKIVP